MALRIAVLKERAPGESRVALTPETAKKFAALGAMVAVEEGAGLGAAPTCLVKIAVRCLISKTCLEV